jgi:hypothetical protein
MRREFSRLKCEFGGVELLSNLDATFAVAISIPNKASPISTKNGAPREGNRQGNRKAMKASSKPQSIKDLPGGGLINLPASISR